MKRSALILVIVLAGFGHALAGSPAADSLLPVRAGGLVLYAGDAPDPHNGAGPAASMEDSLNRRNGAGSAASMERVGVSGAGIVLTATTERVVETELEDIESGYHSTGDHRRPLNRLLKMFGSDSAGWNRRVRYRLFDDLARVSARLRLYPLAMKCYYNASRQTGGLPADSNFYRGDTVAESMPVSVDSIRLAFEDGRDAVAYALLVEVKQPVPGKRKAFTHFNNVGHTFITLIKYNRDSSIVYRSFGFYPKKAGFLDATPLHPSSPSVIKNDSRHEWDELAGKFITERQFNKIIGVLQSYNGQVYNLNHRNCTDFGLTMAGIGGIRIERTAGHWPLGRGNNPGSAGESLLEGKVSNADTTSPEALFVASNELAKPF